MELYSALSDFAPRWRNILHLYKAKYLNEDAKMNRLMVLGK